MEFHQEESSLSTDLSLNIHGPVITSSSITKRPQRFFPDHERKTTMWFQEESSLSTDLSLNIHGPVITSFSIPKPQTFFPDHERKTTVGFQGESTVSTELSLNIHGPVMTSSIITNNTKQQPFYLDDHKYVPLIKTTILGLFQGEFTVSTSLSLNIHGPASIPSTTKQKMFVLDDLKQLPFEKRSMPQVDLSEKTKRIFEKKVEDPNSPLVEDEKREKKKRKITKKMERGPAVMSNDVPEKLEQFIKGEMINGVDIKLVIQKKLFASDLKPSQNRLNMPIKQLVTHDFLKADEKQFLEMDKENTIEVQVVGPTLQMYKKPMRFKRWQQRCTYNYVLITNWNHFVAANQEVLKEGSIIQVWSFRRNQQLCFAIVVVGSPDDMNSVA